MTLAAAATGKISFTERYHVDLPLLFGLILITGVGLIIMYSASGQNMPMMHRQLTRIGLAFLLMIITAQIPYRYLQLFSPYFFFSALLLLLAVLEFGETTKGAQRWLTIGVLRFQPSELMKLALPLLLAAFLGHYAQPPKHRYSLLALALVILCIVLIAKQPDLGTAILIGSSGLFVLFLSGIHWGWISMAILSITAFIPVMWFFLMHSYQRTRVLTLFNPESDPLGAGYHIIQSKIAIGSGGIIGKGWLNGTQSKLEFLPERHTDFIFAVIAEEWGLAGVVVLLFLYLFIVGRGLWIAHRATTAFGRMLAGSITLSFFTYVFVNIGMVSGLLPVVGIPLPLISYGGTSMVTLMVGFGLLMSIHTHKTLLSQEV